MKKKRKSKERFWKGCQGRGWEIEVERRPIKVESVVEGFVRGRLVSSEEEEG